MKKRDNKLVSKLKQGSSQTLNEIYKLYYRGLCFFAYRLISHQQEAEDIVAESFIKLWDKRENFNNLESIKAFLFITTKNACLNFLRKNKRETELQQYLNNEKKHTSPEEEIFFAEMEAEMLQQIYHEIEQLPRKCKMIFKLIYIEGAKTDEVAKKLQISNKTVLNQKLRGIRLLQESLKEKETLNLLSLLLFLS